MKKSHIKIIAKIEEKIAFYELLSKGQINDNDAESSKNTSYKIEGLKECIQVIKDLKQKDVTKSILKEANKFLCLQDDLTILETVNLIIANYNESGNKTIDWIDNVCPIETFEHTFDIVVFLNLIGIKCTVNEQIALLK